MSVLGVAPLVARSVNVIRGLAALPVALVSRPDTVTFVPASTAVLDGELTERSSTFGLAFVAIA